MRRLFNYFGHPHHVLRRFEVLQRRGLCTELNAQSDDWIRACYGAFLLVFLARQASEQYNTESQFLAHALRHVMVRPHTAQSLLGSDCLLPLKSLFIHWVVRFRQTGRLAQTGWVVLPPCAWALL